jgi:hypothetical protein
MPVLGPSYQSPPGSGGNDGALPKVWDPGYQNYINLTPQQVVAFQSMPQALLLYAGTRRWMAEISGTTVAGVPLTTQDRDQSKISQLKQAYDTGVKTGTTSFSDAVGNTQVVDAAAVTAIYTGIVLFVDATYETYATLKAGIKAAQPTITTRKQIDTAYAAISPNSPSATKPSST